MVVFALALIVISGIDIYLLQKLSFLAKTSPALADVFFFSNEISVALYLLPALFAGLGVNMLSHILVGHLRDAETRFDQEQGNLRRNSSP